MVYKIVLWGLGQIYNQSVNRIKWFEETKQISVVAVTANGGLPEGMKKLDGYDYVLPNEITVIDFDYIVVLNKRCFNNIFVQLTCEYGIPKEKILKHSVFELPNLIFDVYIQLKNANISMICNNCYGGMLFNTLGLEFLSPTKNLSLSESGVMKIVTNPDYWLNCRPEFVRFQVDPHSQEQYPVLAIDDIEIHCNHEKEPESAIDNWVRRSHKVNKSNLFPVIYTTNKRFEQEFSELPFQKKVCFVPYETDIPSSVKLEMYEGQSEFYEAVNFNASMSGIKYDLVKLLLYGQVYSRYR